MYAVFVWVVALVAAATLTAIALRNTRWAHTSLRVSQWTYGIVYPLSLLYFPMHVGWRVHPVDCEWTFDLRLALYSFRNFGHEVLFVVFFLLSYAQLLRARRPLAWCFLASFVMGFLVEIAQGATGFHHCRMRDLIPDMTGATVGAIVILIARAVRRRT